MANRLPSKVLEGKRIRILTAPHQQQPGEITKVDTLNGNVTVLLESGASVTLNWDNGDRWVINATAKPYSYA